MAYASRGYAQIKKEALVLMWACERLSDYVLGKEIQLEMDHKPQVPILGMKSLDRHHVLSLLRNPHLGM